MQQKYSSEISRRSVMFGIGALGATAVVKPDIVVSQEDSILTVRTSADIRSLDPAYYQIPSEGDIISTIFAGLVRHSSGDKWEINSHPIAEIIQLDSVSIKFILRDNIGFTNGFGQMSANDVKFALERVANPENESPHRNDWFALLKIDTLDKLSGIIRLKFPYLPFVNSVLPKASASILSQSALEESGGRIGTVPYAQSGKYIVSEFIPREKLVLKRNPDWIGNRGEFDEIRIIPIEETVSAEYKFEIGEIDFTQTYTSSYPRLVDYPPAGGVLLKKPKLAFVWLGINQESSPLDNINIRRAIQFAIDRKAVVKEAYFGAAKTSTGIIPPGMIGTRERNLYNFSSTKALNLLEREGVSNMKISLDILNQPEMHRAARKIQENLGNVGIICKIFYHDYLDFLKLGSKNSNSTDSKNKLQLVINKYQMGTDPSSATASFVPEQIGSWNKEHFNSKEFSELHSKALTEIDSSDRDMIYKRMQDIMEESGCYVFLTHEVTTYLHRNTIVPALKPNGEPLYGDFKINR